MGSQWLNTCKGQGHERSQGLVQAETKGRRGIVAMRACLLSHPLQRPLIPTHQITTSLLIKQLFNPSLGGLLLYVGIVSHKLARPRSDEMIALIKAVGLDSIYTEATREAAEFYPDT